jgi:soluble lytic murein transglycosylase-like protein
MATENLTFKAPVSSPVVLTSPTSWYKTRDGLKEQMIKVWGKYGKWFKEYGGTSGIPPEILFAFTMVESGGNPLAGGSSSPTQGLMQWNKNFAGGSGNTDFVLTKEFLNGRLNEFEKNKLKSFGITFDAKGNTRAITQADLQNPELNILIGSIILNQYLDQSWGKEDGKIRMDRIIARYNWGSAGFRRNTLDKKDLKEVLANIPAVTATYIHKMLGKNGALDIALNDKKDFA